MAIRHLNQAQQALLATLDQLIKTTPTTSGQPTNAEGKGRPVHNQLHWTHTAAQQVFREALHFSGEQGLSIRAISRTLGIAKNTLKNYRSA